MYGLNIHLISFRLNSQIIGPRDKIRVSITTLPEENKDWFVISANEIHKTEHFFGPNITDKTEKIIFVFRKKSLFQSDPIIASTIVYAKDFPRSKTDEQNSEVKRINIYEPISKTPGNLYENENRQIYGQMQIQMTLHDPFPDPTNKKNYNYNISKIHNGEGYSKVNSFGINENEYNNQNNSIFVDSGF